MPTASPLTVRTRARRIALQIAIGALLGFVLWSIFGPQVVSWWYEPPSKDAFSCASSVRGALAEFVKMQAAAALAGAVAVALLVFLARMLWTRLFGGGGGALTVPSVDQTAAFPAGPPAPPISPIETPPEDVGPKGIS